MRSVILASVFWAVGLSAVLPAAIAVGVDALPVADPSDGNRLQGTWVCVEVIHDGRRVDTYVGVRAVIQGDVLTWYFPRPGGPERVKECRFTIDASKNPGHFDWWPVDKPAEVHRRLYILEGDTLKWASDLGAEPRPKAFDAAHWQFLCKRRTAAPARRRGRPAATCPSPPVQPDQRDQPWLGVSRWQANQREVVLCGVLRDGPAGKAGLRVDDTILSIGGTAVRDLGDFHAAIDDHRPGDQVRVEFERDGRRGSVLAELESLPPDGGTGRIRAAAEAGESWAMMDLGVRDRPHARRSIVLRGGPGRGGALVPARHRRRLRGRTPLPGPDAPARGRGGGR